MRNLGKCQKNQKIKSKISIRHIYPFQQIRFQKMTQIDFFVLEAKSDLALPVEADSGHGDTSEQQQQAESHRDWREFLPPPSSVPEKLWVSVPRVNLLAYIWF